MNEHCTQLLGFRPGLEMDPIEGPVYCEQPSGITLPVGNRMTRLCPRHAADWAVSFVEVIAWADPLYAEALRDALHWARWSRAEAEAATA